MRLQTKGLTHEGIKVRGNWVDIKGSRCFQLSEELADSNFDIKVSFACSDITRIEGGGMPTISKVLGTLVSWAKKMPPIYKILADYLAWSMFITTLATLFSTLYIGIESGELYDLTNTAPIKYAAFFAGFGFLAVLTVVIMVLSEKLKK